MSFFKNKHVIVAMIVTPVLAMLGYYVTDLVVKERPHVAKKGQSYALVAKSNCRYTSGRCDIENANFKASLTVHNEGNTQVLKLESSHALEGVTVGFVEQGKPTTPEKMLSSNPNLQQWSMPFSALADENTTIRLALAAQGTHYFAETTLGFSEYKTSFTKKF